MLGGVAAGLIGAGCSGGAETEWITCGVVVGGLTTSAGCGAGVELALAVSLGAGGAGFGIQEGSCFGGVFVLPFFGNNKAVIQPRLSVLGFSGFFMRILHLNNLTKANDG
jgi:hypothetical protein